MTFDPFKPAADWEIDFHGVVFAGGEHEDGTWTCRRGPVVYDEHADLPTALAHLRDIARSLGPAHLFAHPYQGAVQRVES